MKALLDENIPVGLASRLSALGWEVDHPVLSNRRGLPDAAFFERIHSEEDLIFLTHDSDFDSVAASAAGQVVISHVNQSRPLSERIDIWAAALEALRRESLPERLFDLLDDGTLVPTEILEL